MSWIVPQLPACAARGPKLTLHVYFGSGGDLCCACARARSAAPSVRCVSTIPRSTPCACTARTTSSRARRRSCARGPCGAAAAAARHTLVDERAALALYSAYWRGAAGGALPLRFARVVHFRHDRRHPRRRARGRWRRRLAALPRGARSRGPSACAVVFPRVRPLHDYFRLIFRGDDPRAALYRRSRRPSPRRRAATRARPPSSRSERRRAAAFVTGVLSAISTRRACCSGVRARRSEAPLDTLRVARDVERHVDHLAHLPALRASFILADRWQLASVGPRSEAVGEGPVSPPPRAGGLVGEDGVVAGLDALGVGLPGALRMGGHDHDLGLARGVTHSAMIAGSRAMAGEPSPNTSTSMTSDPAARGLRRRRRSRTPVGRHGGALAEVRPDDLGALVMRELVRRAGVDPAAIEDVLFGCASSSAARTTATSRA